MTLLLAYYGDDFTGSTDALEILTTRGISTVLFLDPPTPLQLRRYPGLQAFGVAGISRSLEPDAMERTLRPAFEALKQSGASHIHYKVCSTFDSSPQIGSIGKAAEIGKDVFSTDFISLVVASPALGRYCAFGNLFARMGIGSNGAIHRLDRHPSMSRHPVTPAHESDLRQHLSLQTALRTGLVDILEVENGPESMQRALHDQLHAGNALVLFDALYPPHMEAIGMTIGPLGSPEKPHFSIGSSGIESALTAYWTENSQTGIRENWPAPGKASPLLVASGSCSPVTAAQIDWALRNGFEEIALDTASIARTSAYDFSETVQRAVAFIQSGKSLVIHTGKGPDDRRLAATAQILSEKGLSPDEIQQITAPLYGGALGKIVRSVAAQTGVPRIVIAGGDTSGIVARHLGIEAIEMLAPLSPGAPLCKAYAPGSPLHGCEVNFKGGQVGPENYFGILREGDFVPQ